MKTKLFFIVILMCFSLQAQKNKHTRWNEMLGKYVDTLGNVDYKAWSKETANLEAYIQTLKRLPPLESASKSAKLSYWINAYNALTVQLILQNYPTESIRDLNEPWERKLFEVKNKSYSLGEIEHQILRKMDEPRIHFAINCASASCPKLLNEAYQEKKLEFQLSQATRHFVNDTTKNKISHDQLKLSRIFLWFGNDFGSKSERLQFIARYSKSKFKTPKIDYLPYNWSLNESH